MKKIVFALLMTMGMLNAQNNLVFNQVLILDFTNNAAEPYIVPEGKVWKVESATLGSTFKVDGNTWTMGDLGSYRRGAIWIPENSALSGGSSDADFISLLEFDVVPTSTGTGSGSGGGGVSSDGLVFSEVINQFIPTSSVTGAFGTVAGSFIVPEGKIWKIHKMTHNKISTSTGGFISLNGSLYVSMDGIPIYAIGTSYNINSSTTANNFLTPGTYELKWYQGSGAGGPFFSGTITHLVAIEYNMPQ